MSNPIVENLTENKPTLPPQRGPAGVEALPGRTPNPALNIPSSAIRSQELWATEVEGANTLQNPQGLGLSSPEYTGPTTVQGGSELQDPQAYTQQAGRDFQAKVDWMEARNEALPVPVYSENLNIPQIALPTSPYSTVNPGDLGALAAKRQQARSGAANSGVYYGPAGGIDGRGGVPLPENMERYSGAIDTAIRANRSRGSEPDPTGGVARDSVRGVFGLLGAAGRALLGTQRGGARAAQEARTGQATGRLTPLDWIAGTTVGGLALLNSEGRKAWRTGFSEQMSGLSAAEREGLAQLTPTTQTGRKGFGDYGSHALGAVNYGLDFVGNQIRANIAARKETGQWISTPANRAQLSAATLKHLKQAQKGKDYSFLNPDSPLTLFDKGEKNPTWWKTAARTTANVVLDTVTGGPDPLGLVIESRRALTRASSKGATRLASPPSPKGGAIVPYKQPITLYPTPVKSKPLNPARTLPPPPQKLLPSRYLIDDPWDDTPNPTVVQPSTPGTRPRTTLALPGTVEPLGPDLHSPLPVMGNPWYQPMDAPLTRPRLPNEPGPVFERVSPYHPLRADQFTPEADPWGQALGTSKPIALLPGTVDKPRTIPVAPRLLAPAPPTPPLPDPWDSDLTSFATKAPSAAPVLDLNRAVPLTESIRVLALPPASGIGKVDTTPQLARPWTPDTDDVLPLSVTRKPEAWELFDSQELTVEPAVVLDTTLPRPPEEPPAPRSPKTGEPWKTTVYHSTSEEGAASLAANGVQLDANSTGRLGRGFYTTTRPENGELYGKTQVPIEVDLKNPLVLGGKYKPLEEHIAEATGRPLDEVRRAVLASDDTRTKYLQSLGYDGLYAEYNDYLVAFDPSTAKPKPTNTSPVAPSDVPTTTVDVPPTTPKVEPEVITGDPSSVEARIAALEQTALANEERITSLTKLRDELEADPFVVAMRDPEMRVPDPDMPQKVLSHAMDSGTLHPTRGGGVVSSVDVVRAAQYKLVDLRLKQQTIREQAANLIGSSLRQDQLLETADQMQEVIDELRVAITGRPMRKDFTSALSPEEVDTHVPVISMDVLDPTPHSGPDYVNRLRSTPPTSLPDVVTASSATPVSRSAEDLSALARVLGHTSEPRVLGWDELGELNSKHGLYSPMGPEVPRGTLDQALSTGVTRVEVAKGTVSTPQVTMVVRNTPRVLTPKYQKAVVVLGKDYREAMPDDQAWAALSKLAPMGDESYLTLVDTWVKSDGRGGLRRTLNSVLPEYPPSETMYSALTARYGGLSAKERGKLPKGLRELLADPSRVRTANDGGVGLRLDKVGDELSQLEQATDTPIPVELAVTPDTQSYAARYSESLRRAQDTRESLVELEAQALTLEAQAGVARTDLQAAPAIEPRSLLEGTHENGTYQDTIVSLYEDTLDDPRSLFPEALDDWATVDTPPPPVVYEGRWYAGDELPSAVDPSRGNIPPGWRLVSLERDMAELNATARVPANTIFAEVDAAPVVRQYTIPTAPRIVSIDTVLPDRVRANLVAALGSHLDGPLVARLGKGLGELDTKYTIHDVLRLFENDHIRINPNTPISEVDGARYNVAVFAALGGEVDLIDLGGGAYLVPHHQLDNTLQRRFGFTSSLPHVSPEKAAELRFALDSTFVTPETLRGPTDSAREYVERTANLDQVLQEHLQKTRDMAESESDKLDSLLDELDVITKETQEYVARVTEELRVRKAEQQTQRLETEHLDIDELANPNCL